MGRDNEDVQIIKKKEADVILILIIKKKNDHYYLSPSESKKWRRDKLRERAMVW